MSIESYKTWRDNALDRMDDNQWQQYITLREAGLPTSGAIKDVLGHRSMSVQAREVLAKVNTRVTVKGYRHDTV